MNIAVLGKSASGKDTFTNKAMREIEGVNKVLMCTTRPIRPGEECGVNYRFLSKEEMKYFKDNDMLASWYETPNELGGDMWEYGYLKEDLMKPGINLVVLNPSAYRQIIEYCKLSVEIICPLIQRIDRSIKRVELTHKNMDEILRRACADEKDFEFLVTDYTFGNSNDDSQYEFFKELIEHYKKRGY